MATTDGDVTTLTFQGASCKIHAFGATVISFKSSDGRENLFVSSQAKLDGSKPIRGGIPLVFPIFGPPTESGSTMPQHGFARRNKWTLTSTETTDTAATAKYELKFANVADGIGEGNSWTKTQASTDGTDCVLTYEIRLQAQELTTTLIVTNTGTSAFSFNALLHTYLAIDDKAATDNAKTFVHGLGGYSLQDKVTPANSGTVQSYDENVSVQAGETDRVYVHPEDHPVVHAQIAAGTASLEKLKLEAAGQINGQVAPVSAVVWNPGPETAAGMSDFGNEEYHDMLCVEPGLLGHQPLLEPGNEGRLTQSLIVSS